MTQTNARGINVVAVVVNWCQPTRTIETVEALRRQTVALSIIVVDNGSNDDSIKILQDRLYGLAHLVFREENGGFGVGCNAGIERAIGLGADFVWLVNNDAIPESNCLAHLLEVARADPLVGAVGAKIVDPTGLAPDHAGVVMNGITLQCQYTLSDLALNCKRYAWISGACLLLNTVALNKCGTFDPKYFMYWEDADLCSRMRHAGYKLSVANAAVVYHTAGTSSHEFRLTRFSWHIDSQWRWLGKHHSNYRLGRFVLFFKHTLKSLIDRDWARLKMTIGKIFE